MARYDARASNHLLQFEFEGCSQIGCEAKKHMTSVHPVHRATEYAALHEPQEYAVTPGIIVAQTGLPAVDFRESVIPVYLDY